MAPPVSTAAARRRSSRPGVISGVVSPRLDGTIQSAWAGALYSSSCTSDGMIMAAGACWLKATRIARSSTFGSCSGTVTISQYCDTTSLYSVSRSISCR